MTDLKLKITELKWESVYKMDRGSTLIKGRKSNIYWPIRHASASITSRYGCYSWQANDNIKYCGSFSSDYKRKEFTSNLEGRVHNYLQNHGGKARDRKNTNKYVFDSILNELNLNDVNLCLLKFKAISLNDSFYSYDDFSKNSTLVKAIEAILIYHYLRSGQCEWNRA